MATIQLISTMAQPLMVYECTMVFEAIDPTDGSTVAGVTITDPVVAGVNLSDNSTGPPLPAPFQLLPVDVQP